MRYRLPNSRLLAQLGLTFRETWMSATFTVKYSSTKEFGLINKAYVDSVLKDQLSEIIQGIDKHSYPNTSPESDFVKIPSGDYILKETNTKLNASVRVDINKKGLLINTYDKARPEDSPSLHWNMVVASTLPTDLSGLTPGIHIPIDGTGDESNAGIIGNGEKKADNRVALLSDFKTLLPNQKRRTTAEYLSPGDLILLPDPKSSHHLDDSEYLNLVALDGSEIPISGNTALYELFGKSYPSTPSVSTRNKYLGIPWKSAPLGESPLKPTITKDTVGYTEVLPREIHVSVLEDDPTISTGTFPAKLLEPFVVNAYNTLFTTKNSLIAIGGIVNWKPYPHTGKVKDDSTAGVYTSVFGSDGRSIGLDVNVKITPGEPRISRDICVYPISEDGVINFMHDYNRNEPTLTSDTSLFSKNGEYPTPIFGATSVLHNGWLYVIGGLTDSHDTNTKTIPYRNTVNDAGEFSPTWLPANKGFSILPNLLDPKVWVQDDFMVVTGGLIVHTIDPYSGDMSSTNNAKTYIAKINSDGSLNDWRQYGSDHYVHGSHNTNRQSTYITNTNGLCNWVLGTPSNKKGMETITCRIGKPRRSAPDVTSSNNLVTIPGMNDEEAVISIHDSGTVYSVNTSNGVVVATPAEDFNPAFEIKIVNPTISTKPTKTRIRIKPTTILTDQAAYLIGGEEIDNSVFLKGTPHIFKFPVPDAPRQVPVSEVGSSPKGTENTFNLPVTPIVYINGKQYRYYTKMK